MSKKETFHRKHLLHAAVLLALGATASATYAAVTATNGNFTMLDGSGAPVGGTNDVAFTWDGTLNTDVNTAVSNATITSVAPTPFFGLVWTAYNVKVYGPGSYSIPTADTAGDAGCPYGLTTCATSGSSYSVTVPAGNIMAHMKFAWGSTEGIDVVNVWAPGSWSVLNPTDSIFTGAGGTYTGPVYGLLSTDWDSDNNAGSAMLDGPFAGFNANFSVNTGGAATPACPPSCPPSETQLTAPEPSTAGGGCSIGSTSVSTLERAEWWLVAGFLAWLGTLRLRFKRQQARS